LSVKREELKITPWEVITIQGWACKVRERKQPHRQKQK
jgi:hypothetical protein